MTPHGAVAMLIIAAAFTLVACERKDRPATAKFAPPFQKHPMRRIIETPPESNYEATLDSALRTSMIPDGMQQICSQWYPEFGRDVADAFVEWRKRNEATLAELRERSTAVWLKRAGTDEKYVVMVYPHIRKEVIDELMRQSDGLAVEEFKAACGKYPREILKPNWILEQRLRADLTTLRERPRVAAKGT
jgi:hypothetical protein